MIENKIEKTYSKSVRRSAQSRLRVQVLVAKLTPNRMAPIKKRQWANTLRPGHQWLEEVDDVEEVDEEDEEDEKEEDEEDDDERRRRNEA